MEYLKGKAFVGDFAQRTLTNLQVIENQKDDDVRKFEVTQLINSLLGLIVFPKERGVRLTENVPCVNTLKKYVVKPKNEIDSKELMRNLRHAISHSHILFEKGVHKDKDGNSQIETIVFVNCDYEKDKSPCKGKFCDNCRLNHKSSQEPDFYLRIHVDELRDCVKELADELINMTKKPQTKKRSSRK